MRRLTACGSFGFHNAGDEIIPKALSNMFREINFSVDIDVLSRFDKPDLEGVIGLSDIDELYRISKQPLFFSGGGIAENKKTCVMIKVNDFLNKIHCSKIGFLGVSFEPGVEYGFSNKRLLKNILSKSSTGCVYTRDYFSESSLLKNIKGITVETIGDIALWSSPSETLPENVGLPSNFIAVSLCNTWKDNENWYKWIAHEIEMLHLQTGMSVVFVPMSSKFDDDRVTHRKVKSLISNSDYVTCIEQHLLPDEIVKIYSLSSVVIASRLHSCVLAYSQRVPFVGISYHPKLIGFSHTIGCRDYILPRSIPESQTSGYYGYSFEDLNVHKGSLVELAQKSMSDFDFKDLGLYKTKSLTALKKMIASFEI